MRIAAFVFAGLLAACAPGAPEAPRGEPPADPSACAAAGGAMRPVCRLQSLRCVRLYGDAGKPCTDNSQCEGLCLVDGATEGSNLTGRCQKDDDPCGCFFPLEKGAVSPRARCVD